MADNLKFNTTENQTVDRDLLILCLNTGTSEAPVWSPVGKRVSDSSMEYDWSEETNTDILGDTYTTLSKPKVSQAFEPWTLDAGDKAQVKVWNDSIRNQDTNAMACNDMLKLRGGRLPSLFSTRGRFRSSISKRLWNIWPDLSPAENRTKNQRLSSWTGNRMPSRSSPMSIK